MTTNGKGDVDGAKREGRVIVISGVFMSYVGLALYALSDERLTHFLSSAMVLTGILMAIPQLVPRR